MSKLDKKPTYEELLKEIAELKKINSKLNNIIRKLQDNQGLEICEYFNNCNSLSQTTYEFGYESVQDCFEALREYNGCSDSLYNASDYDIYRKEIFDEESEEDKNSNEESDEDNNSITDEIDNM